MKTTAKLSYRNYVPSDVIAIKFVNLDFFGDRAAELRSDFELVIKKDAERRCAEEIKELKKSSEEGLGEATHLLNNLPTRARWYNGFIQKKREKTLLQVITSYNMIIKSLDETEIDSILIYDMFEYDEIFNFRMRLANGFLQELGAVLLSKTPCGQNAPYYDEIYEIK